MMKEYIGKLYNHGVPVGDLSGDDDSGDSIAVSQKTAGSIQNNAAIFEMDDCGFIVTWDNNARSLYGYDQEDVVGKHYSMLFGVSELVEGKAALSLLAAQKRGWHFGEVWQSRKNGRRFLAYFENEALLDERGRIIGYRNNITELIAE